MRRGESDNPGLRQGGAVAFEWRCEWFACTKVYFTWDKPTADHIEWKKIAPKPSSDEGTQIEVALFGGPLAAGNPQPLSLPEEIEVQPCPAGCKCKYGPKGKPAPKAKVQITVPVTVGGTTFSVPLAVPAIATARFGQCR